MQSNDWWDSGRWGGNHWPQMMGDMHFPGMMPLIILLLVLLVGFLLVLFFRRPAPSDHITASSFASLHPSRSERPARTISNAGIELPAGHEGSGTFERETYLVIPDISGYTRFLSLNRFSLSHAQHVISQLLSAVIESVSPQLAPAKIEGDAILFSGFADQTGQLVGADLGATVASMLSDFYAKRDELHRSNLCPCNACKRIAELDLKVFIHRGAVLRYRLAGFSELSGVPVVTIHRLLKNSLSLQRYIMVTEAAFPNCKLPLNINALPHVEDYDGTGKISSYVFAFEIDDFLSAETLAEGVPPQAKTRDLAQKLSKNVYTFGKSIGLTR